MKRILPLLTLLISFNFAQEDTNINTNSDSFGMWKTSYYVDEFGDYGDVGYIKGSAKGYFNNSATTNSDLNVTFIVDTEISTIPRAKKIR